MSYASRPKHMVTNGVKSVWQKGSSPVEGQKHWQASWSKSSTARFTELADSKQLAKLALRLSVDCEANDIHPGFLPDVP